MIMDNIFDIDIQAAVLYGLNKPLVIDQIRVKELLEGQVFVKIYFSGVCRSQLMEARGSRGFDPWLPHLLGHEASGEVIAVGKGVTKVKVGDKVILGWIKGDGIDANGAKYINKKGEIINSGKVTTFSNYSVVSENRITKLDVDIPRDVAVLFGCALPTGAGIVYNELKPKENENIAIVGLGGIGLSALMALNEYNLNKIIAVDISKEKLEYAIKLGATDTLNPLDKKFEEKKLKLLNKGVDGCVESGGKIESIELGISLLKNTGRMYFASHPENGKKISIDPFELISGKKIFGSWGGAYDPEKDIVRLSSNFKRGNYPLDELIKKRYTLNEINNALDDLEKGVVFRPLIKMNH